MCFFFLYFVITTDTRTTPTPSNFATPRIPLELLKYFATISLSVTIMLHFTLRYIL